MPAVETIAAEGAGAGALLAEIGSSKGRRVGGGWVVALSYEVGRVWEPKAGLLGMYGEGWPGVIAVRVEGTVQEGVDRELAFDAGEVRVCERGLYTDSVKRAIEYIRSGDVYQVNLAHRMRASFAGSSRGLFAAMCRDAQPRFGAYLEADLGAERLAIASASPELFLSFDPESRRVETRPMKGTRPGEGDRKEFEESEKDRAELAMIVDLMRNDLGRVCELGSVRVEAARTIEQHAQGRVMQATGRVSGTLGAGLGVAELLRATFPPGSVTGAPKIRAMQIIEQLEGKERGLYCGTIGYIADDGRAWFNVAIRTATVRGRPGGAADEIEDGVLESWVGAGIVADSDPDAEWEETLVKARGLYAALAQCGPAKA